MLKVAFLCCVLLPVVSPVQSNAGERAEFVVSAAGDGNFRKVQEALDFIDSLPPKAVTVLIRNGVYEEKIYIRRSNLSLVGEDRDSTRIVFAELREEWNRNHGGSDWGAGVVNIDSGVTDLTLANLTVYNNYGWQHGVFNKHQFAIRGGGTRIMLLYCTVISDGGDALSLWNKIGGMYYHADCRFEGWVDFVCPRGWCYITRSRFFGHNVPSASIWHDGSSGRSQKFVIRDSFFDGVPGFPLGRNHLDGQFYLLNCRFSAHMADRPFTRPPSSPAPWKWGDRHYFYGCHRDGGDYAWFSDNLGRAEGSPRESDITAKWTFDGKWDPEAALPEILPFAAFPVPGDGASGVPVREIELRWVSGRNAVSHIVHFGEPGAMNSSSTAERHAAVALPLKGGTKYCWSVDEVTQTDTVRGATWTFTTAVVPQ